MKKHRFVPKSYGRGFVPVRWQGRLFTLLLLTVMGLSAYHHGFFEPNGMDPTFNDAAGFLVDLYLVIFASLRFMDTKTDGKLQWRRGHTRKKHKKSHKK